MQAPNRAAIAVAFALLPSAASAEVTNWAREYIKARQAGQIARVLGDEAAHQFLNAPAPKIVGGTVAPAGRWPAQVALVIKSVTSNYSAQYCGGTLVHRRFVLTAAHCSDFVTAAQVQVLTGTQTLVSGGTRRAVKKITIHPNWNDVTFAFDVAVWELISPVAGITPAPMIAAAQEINRADPGTPTFVTGWGAMSEGGVSSPALQQVSVPIIRRSACNAFNSYNGDVTLQMICAGTMLGGKDSCQGDSGGPLWVRNSLGQFKLVAGITSWGVGCAAPNFPGVYTRLALFSAWVKKVINAALN